MTSSDINSVNISLIARNILHLGLVNNKKLGLAETRLTSVLYKGYLVLHTFGEIQKKLNRDTTTRSTFQHYEHNNTRNQK